MRPGDDLNSDQYGQNLNRYPPTGLSAAPAHGGQLGASGQQLRDHAASTGAAVGPAGMGGAGNNNPAAATRGQFGQFDRDAPGQNARTFGGGPGPAAPPASVQAQATKPSAGERIIGVYSGSSER